MCLCPGLRTQPTERKIAGHELETESERRKVIYVEASVCVWVRASGTRWVETKPMGAHTKKKEQMCAPTAALHLRKGARKETKKNGEKQEGGRRSSGKATHAPLRLDLVVRVAEVAVLREVELTLADNLVVLPVADEDRTALQDDASTTLLLSIHPPAFVA